MSAILPFLRNMVQEQNIEKELEAKSQGAILLFYCFHLLHLCNICCNLLYSGVPLSEVRLQKTVCPSDERLYWYLLFFILIFCLQFLCGYHGLAATRMSREVVLSLFFYHLMVLFQ